MSPRTHTIITAVAAAAVVLAVSAARQASAGRKDLWTVTVDTGNFRAYGSMGSARNSSDTVQSIGCSTFYDPANGVNQATCVAVDSAGTFARCMTQDPTKVAATFAMTSDSYVQFSWEKGTEECIQIFISNMSNNEPKLP